MRHERAVELICERELEALDEGTRSELEAHLAECPECRGYQELYRELRAAVTAPQEAGGGHPTPAELVAVALLDGPADSENRERIEAHVAQCAACSAELDLVRRVEAESPKGWEDSVLRDGLRGVRRGPWFGIAVAAAVMVAAMAYPAYRGVSVSLERGAAGGWSGPVDLHVLRSPLRHGGEPTRVVVEPDAPYVLLALELTIPPEGPTPSELRVELIAAEQGTIFTLRLPSDESPDDLHLS
ncbi:MAG: hypothetical protein GVY30_09300 [Chloroflexi bacterium]|jgi:anti-sigma factor RsiW|nr:hypothetical protein [Chloroflexota bacterium]